MKVQIISAFKNDIWYKDHLGKIFEVEFVKGTIIYKVVGINGGYIRNEDCIDLDIMRERKLNEMLK